MVLVWFSICPIRSFKRHFCVRKCSPCFNGIGYIKGIGKIGRIEGVARHAEHQWLTYCRILAFQYALYAIKGGRLFGFFGEKWRIEGVARPVAFLWRVYWHFNMPYMPSKNGNTTHQWLKTGSTHAEIRNPDNKPQTG